MKEEKLSPIIDGLMIITGAGLATFTKIGSPKIASSGRFMLLAFLSVSINAKTSLVSSQFVYFLTKCHYFIL
jgi:hypothetical protein